MQGNMKLMRVILAGCIAGCCFSTTQPTPTAEAATLILYNGRVWTVDDECPEAQAVAVRGETIIKVGRNAEVLALKGPATKIIDLQGRLVLPGFNDAHMHSENAVDWVFYTRIVNVRDQTEMLERPLGHRGRPLVVRVARGAAQE